VLHIAAVSGHTQIMRLALREFPSIYHTPSILSYLVRSGKSLLRLAIYGNLDCVRELLLVGAPLELCGPDGNEESDHTPLGESIQGGLNEMARFLLQSGACPSCRGPPAERR
jgi:hypothetical protein